jgi:hypothetical protein
LLRSPLPTMESTNEPNARRLFRNLREDLGLRPNEHLAGALTDLPPDLRDDLETELDRVIDGASFFQRENPLVRHVVLRKRTTLEERGLLDGSPSMSSGAGLVRTRTASMPCSRGSPCAPHRTSTGPTRRRA